MDIKKLLSKSQVQLCLFSLGFSFLVFHPWFIPHQGMDHSFSRTCGHLHAASSQHYYFQAPALETRGLMRSQQSPSHSRGIRRAHPMPFGIKHWFLVSSANLQTVISTKKHFIVPLCVLSLCAGLRDFQLKTSARSRKWEGRKGGWLK